MDEYSPFLIHGAGVIYHNCFSSGAIKRFCQKPTMIDITIKQKVTDRAEFYRILDNKFDKEIVSSYTKNRILEEEGCDNEL